MTTRVPGPIDHRSRGDVAQHLERLQTNGTVKKCIHLRLDRMPGGYYPKCEHDYASMEPPPYLGADSWPRCPDDCPYYWESLNFRRTVSRDQYMDLSPGDVAVKDGEENPFLKVATVPVPDDPPPATAAIAIESPQLDEIDWDGFKKLVSRMRVSLIAALVVGALGVLGTVATVSYQLGVFMTELRQARDAKPPPHFDLTPPSPNRSVEPPGKPGAER